MSDQKKLINSESYLKKKQFFDQLMTLYGRKPVLEALTDDSLNIYRLHLAESNKPQGIIKDITQIAQQRGIEIHYHTKHQLSRISKNSKQDQGVCVDIICPQHNTCHDFLNTVEPQKNIRLIALDGITNPQNLGMIIRSVCAGKIDGLLLPEKGCAKIDPLVIKASAGTLFKAPLLHCQNLVEALRECQQHGALVCGLSSHATLCISDPLENNFIVYVLGNETHGLSDTLNALCDQHIAIPMNNNVESLNVAITASLLAFKDVLS